MSTRLDNVRRVFQSLDNAPDALLLTDIGSLGYVSGFTGSTAQALITPDEALFITDSRYTLRALAECKDFQVVETPSGSGGYGEALQNVLKERPVVHRLGFEAGHVTVAQLEAFRGADPRSSNG